MKRALAWSCGGGKQSTAIAALIILGRLPVPDVMLMADTGREQTKVLDYVQGPLNAALRAAVGREIEVVDQRLATVGLYSLKKGDILIPAFTTQNLSARGEPGKLDTYCSTEWKRRVISRRLRELGYGVKRPVRLWIGISLDEVGRAKPSEVKWLEHWWPLLYDVPLRRNQCDDIIAEAGLPPAVRSSCWMCPLHSNAEWRHIRDGDPGDWHRAVAFDEGIRARDPHLFVHRSGKPLAAADIETDPVPQPNLFGGVDACDSGMCFV